MEQLDLLDWKRRVFEIYRDVRLASDHQTAWARWCAERNVLFAAHPQSPLAQPQRRTFAGLTYFEYTPGARVLAQVEERDPKLYDIPTSGGSSSRMRRFATASFDLFGRSQTLELYWLEEYGGGLFLPFRDATSGDETYGAGRYLLDTVKGADLGVEESRLVLDFNFAYNPSCVYDPRWICPLTPPANRLPVPVRAGERLPT